jgi:hypothetical protein
MTNEWPSLLTPKDKIVPIIAFGRRFLVEPPPRSSGQSQETSEILPSHGVIFYTDGPFCEGRAGAGVFPDTLDIRDFYALGSLATVFFVNIPLLLSFFRNHKHFLNKIHQQLNTFKLFFFRYQLNSTYIISLKLPFFPRTIPLRTFYSIGIKYNINVAKETLEPKSKMTIFRKNSKKKCIGLVADFPKTKKKFEQKHYGDLT